VASLLLLLLLHCCGVMVMLLVAEERMLSVAGSWICNNTSETGKKHVYLWQELEGWRVHSHYW
jgi:hypothetical protein